MATGTSRRKVLSVEGKFEAIWEKDFSALQIPFTSLHFTYHLPTPFPRKTRFPPHFEFPSLHFTSLHVTSLHFTSLHVTSLHFTCFLKFLGLEGKVPKSFIVSLFQSWMVLFTKEYFPISFLCLLFLIFLT